MPTLQIYEIDELAAKDSEKYKYANELNGCSSSPSALLFVLQTSPAYCEMPPPPSSNHPSPATPRTRRQMVRSFSSSPYLRTTRSPVSPDIGATQSYDFLASASYTPNSWTYYKSPGQGTLPSGTEAASPHNHFLGSRDNTPTPSGNVDANSKSDQGLATAEPGLCATSPPSAQSHSSPPDNLSKALPAVMWSPYTKRIACSMSTAADGRGVLYNNELPHGYSSIDSAKLSNEKLWDYAPEFSRIDFEKEIMIQRFNPRDLWRSASWWLHVDAHTPWGGLAEHQFQLFCLQCWECHRYVSKVSAELHVCPPDHLEAVKCPSGSLDAAAEAGLFQTMKDRFTGVKVPGLLLEELETYFVRCKHCRKVMTRASSFFHDDSALRPPYE